MKLLDRQIGGTNPIFIIAGPCVIESEDICYRIADELARLSAVLGIQIIFKASFDKANRTSIHSFRGLGMSRGLEILAGVRARTGLAVLTDVHEASQIAAVAEVADVLQTPAFLARQTDFIQAVSRVGRPVNIKKGQFMAPKDMAHVVEKCGTGADIMLCERGTTFGYGDLVVDMRGLLIMAETGRPVVFDATHSVQQPGALIGKSGGDNRHVPALARAAVAAGVAGVFMETHPDPATALSDGPNMVPLDRIGSLIGELIRIDEIVKN